MVRCGMPYHKTTKWFYGILFLNQDPARVANTILLSVCIFVQVKLLQIKSGDHIPVHSCSPIRLRMVANQLGLTDLAQY